MNYLHEHTWLANYGHLLIITAFVCSLMATIAYFVANKQSVIRQLSWKYIAKSFFLVSGISAFAAIAILYYVMLNRYFEFHYVWKYTNHAMNAAYMLASFWSGQEGSLLLWSFWSLVFAFIFMQKFKDWEVPAMPFISLALTFIFSMLLGVYVGDVKIGSSPFILVRELSENVTQAWASMPDYLQKVSAFQDGVGLNPLLQNYWMVIHPPVLFSGFALLLFPFALSLAGLMKNDLKTWIKPAITWSVFGLFTLGTGILMGGAWAYEALSFGGFWAWDPVENASLVPWLILLAGNHQLLITRKRNKGYFMAILFSVLPFIMVLYSSFLTRSGILGESSVHSFTENGLMTHLFLFLFLFITLAVSFVLQKRKPRILFVAASIFLVIAYFVHIPSNWLFSLWMVLVIGFLIFAYQKYYPKQTSDDSISSREFWMMAGILVLVVAAVQITISTSVPVINRLFGTRLDAFTNLDLRNEFYSLWQVPFAIIVMLLMGITQVLKYKTTRNAQKQLRQLKWPFLVSLVITLILVFLFSYGLATWRYALLLFVTLFALGANLQWFWRLFQKNTLQAGSALAHIGFALLITGALISSASKTPISQNQAAFDLRILDESFQNNENVLLRKGDTVKMKNYFITYRGKKREGVNVYYNIGYFESLWDHDKMRWQKGDSLFSLEPFIQQNEQFGQVSEPDTRHYWSHDVFTHIKWADTEMNDHGHPDDDFMNRVFKKVQLGKSYQHDNLRIDFQEIYLVQNAEKKQKIGLKENDIVIGADFLLQDVNQEEKKDLLQPMFVVQDSTQITSIPDYSDVLQVELDILKLSQQENTLQLSIREKEYLVMQAVVFPGMNLLWSGCIVMILGLGIVLVKRWREKNAEKQLSRNPSLSKNAA